MKLRWIFILVLAAFPYAAAFFLRGTGLAEKPAITPAPPPTATSAKPAVSVATSSVAPESRAPWPSRSPAAEPAAVASTTPVAAAPYAPPAPAPVARRPMLLQGTFTRAFDSLVYEADAKLQLADDVTLLSPNGVLVSDEKQTLFVGDMQIAAGANTITAHEGVLDTKAQQMKALVASVTFTDKNNQLVRMTGENVTLEIPLGKTPSEPSATPPSAPAP
jgi:hypothetical protein